MNDSADSPEVTPDVRQFILGILEKPEMLNEELKRDLNSLLEAAPSNEQMEAGFHALNVVIFLMLQEHIKEWIELRDWGDSRIYLHNHQDLMTTSAQEVLERLKSFQTGDSARASFVLHQQILQDAQVSGIDVAYDTYFSLPQTKYSIKTELHLLFAKLMQIVVIPETDLRRQAKLCQLILELDEILHVLGVLEQGNLFSIFGITLGKQFDKSQGLEGVRLLEQAIAYFDRALETFDPSTMQPQCAMTQRNKAAALRQLTEQHGGVESVELLERAIVCYDRALEIYDSSTMTSDYANILHDKATALRQVAEWRGGVAAVELLERAIVCYDRALEIYDPSTMTSEYADTLHNKAITLSELAEQQGSAGISPLKQALACYDRALEIYDPSTMTSEYTDTLHNKAITLRKLARQREGAESVELLEKALDCYDRVLEIYGPSAMTSEYAHTLHNKAIILSELAERWGGGEAFRLSEQALACCNRALEIYDPSTMTAQYAGIYAVKAAALRKLAEQHGGAEAVELLKQAVACYDRALEIYDPSTMTSEYTDTLHDKAVALSEQAEWQGGAGISLLKQAIVCCDRALEISAPSTRASKHTGIFGIKATALRRLAERSRGAEARGMLEQAIACYDETLAIYDPLTFDSDYAMTIQNKAVALQSLARLNAGAVGMQLFEQSIVCYDRALEIRNRLAMTMTRQYANTQLNKGLALDELDERRGAAEAGGLLEQAIACYDNALEIYDSTTMAPDYARAQQSKGTALYRLAERRGGIEALKLLEQAIACYDRALEIRNRMTMTPQYANTQLNKAIALNELAERRGRAEARELLEQAIACYDEALAIYDPLTTAPDYAKAQQNKANALSRLAGLAGVPSVALLEQAIACYDEALAIFDPLTTAPDYAKAQQNKGITLRRLSQRRAGTEGIKLLEQAIACYEDALTIYDPSTMAPDYATAMKNKGIALSNLSKRVDESEAIRLLEKAALSYSTALKYFPQSIAPIEHRTITGLLAEVQLTLAMAESDPTVLLNRALNTVTSGLETAHLFEQLAPSLEFRQEEWSKNADLYATAGTIQALLGATDEAIILLETGRARGLIEALGRQSADLSLLDPTERKEYESAAKLVLDLEARGRQYTDFREALILATEAEKANARLTSIVEHLRKTHPTFLTTSLHSREKLVAGLNPGEVLIYLLPHEGGTFMLLVPHEGEPRAEWLRELTAIQLNNLLIQTDEEGYYTLGYIPAIFGLGPTLLEEALNTLLPVVGERLMSRVVQRAHELDARHIIMIAGDWFSILPLHAATYVPLFPDQTATAPNSQRYACDDVLITYTPSGTTFMVAREAAKRSLPIHKGFVVGNPKQTPTSEPLWQPGMMGYLPFAVEEAEEVASVMRAAGLTVTCKIGADATWRSIIDGLRDANIAHLALHAEFDPFDPLASALMIAPQAKLFLRDLLDPNLVSLTSLRLAVLSACQSGLRDIYEMNEESLGLFGALLAAGAAGVVGTLWPVYDYSTRLLMKEFTRRYLKKGQEPAIALRNCIRWLRRLPDEIPDDDIGLLEENRDFVVGSQEDCHTPGFNTVTQISSASDEADSMDKAQYRASLVHPVHWASFVYYGA